MNKSTLKGSANNYLTHTEQNKGITLIALVITIIVMLILVAVTIDIAVDGKLFDTAREAVDKTNDAVAKQDELVGHYMGKLNEENNNSDTQTGGGRIIDKIKDAEIGAWVDYRPTATGKEYKVSGAYNGEFDSSKYEGGWRVLEVDGEKVYLISAETVGELTAIGDRVRNEYNEVETGVSSLFYSNGYSKQCRFPTKGDVTEDTRKAGLMKNKCLVGVSTLSSSYSGSTFLYLLNNANYVEEVGTYTWSYVVGQGNKSSDHTQLASAFVVVELLEGIKVTGGDGSSKGNAYSLEAVYNYSNVQVGDYVDYVPDSSATSINLASINGSDWSGTIDLSNYVGGWRILDLSGYGLSLINSLSLGQISAKGDYGSSTEVEHEICNICANSSMSNSVRILTKEVVNNLGNASKNLLINNCYLGKYFSSQNMYSDNGMLLWDSEDRIVREEPTCLFKWTDASSYSPSQEILTKNAEVQIVIQLKSNVVITGGDGTDLSPYTIEVK